MGATPSRFGGLFSSPTLGSRRTSSPTGSRSPRISFSSLTPPLSPRLRGASTPSNGAGSPGPSHSTLLPPSVTDTPPDEDLKWISGTLTDRRDLWIYAVQDLRGGPAGLDLYATPTIPELGLWPWSVQMNNVTVGNFLLFKASMVGGHPLATVWAFKLYVAESITMKSPQRPNDPPVTLPPIHNLLTAHGHLPRDKKRPLWEGPDVPNKIGAVYETIDYQKLCRMPNEDHMRSTTLPGINTPIHIKHEFNMQVFYSIWGEDAQGRELPNGGPGEPRMATMTQSVMVAGVSRSVGGRESPGMKLTTVFAPHPPQCCSVFESNLPTYADSIDPCQPDVKPPHEGIMPNCACGMPLEMLFARELARDDGFGDDVHGDAQGRGRRAERKAEYESEHRSQSYMSSRES